MSYQVINEDCIKWCNKHKGQLPSIITSIPDMSEINMNEEQYIPFVKKAVNSILDSLLPKGYAIFIQTDRKNKGLIPKDYYITHEAISSNFRMLFHKIALIKDVNCKDLYKPTYSHVLCFSKKGKPGRSTEDVFHRGEVLYKNGAGKDTVIKCLEFLQQQKINSVVDPFVGHGTTLILALQMGFENCIGIDIDKEQCKITQKNIQKTIKD